MNTLFLDRCFERAIFFEVALRDYYLKMANDFSHVDPVRRFFLELAADEGEHSKMLRFARKSEPNSIRLMPKSRDILQKLDHLRGVVEKILGKPYHDLQGAFKQMHALEQAEIDEVFLMLVSGALGSEQEAENLRASMNAHLKKVSHLSKAYPAPERKLILAR